jgi:hypothetical protein
MKMRMKMSSRTYEYFAKDVRRVAAASNNKSRDFQIAIKTTAFFSSSLPGSWKSVPSIRADEMKRWEPFHVFGHWFRRNLAVPEKNIRGRCRKLVVSSVT